MRGGNRPEEKTGEEKKEKKMVAALIRFSTNDAVTMEDGLLYSTVRGYIPLQPAPLDSSPGLSRAGCHVPLQQVNVWLSRSRLYVIVDCVYLYLIEERCVWISG